MKSNCCNALLVEETDVCSKCKEHCEIIKTEKYIIELDVDFEMTIEIVQNETTLKILHKINNFWSGSKLRLSHFNMCIEKTVCNLIAREVFRLQTTTDMYADLDLVIKAFERDIEGFYPLDGSYGIKIIDLGIPFSRYDLNFSIEKQ